MAGPIILIAGPIRFIVGPIKLIGGSIIFIAAGPIMNGDGSLTFFALFSEDFSNSCSIGGVGFIFCYDLF